MIHIPNNGKWIQPNTSDRLGSISASKGINLTNNIASLNISPRLLVNTESTTYSSLGLPVAFKQYVDGRWFAVCGTKIFNNGGGSGGAYNLFTENTDSGVPTTCTTEASDMILSSSLFVTTASTSIYYYSGSSWSSFIIPGLGSSGRKLMVQYAQRTYVVYGNNRNQITSFDESLTYVASVGVDQYSLNLPSGFYITFMKAVSDGIWIGTQNNGSGSKKCSIFKWDGSQTSPNYEYKQNTVSVLSACVKNDILYVMDSNGALLQFSGGGFIEIARLPVPKGYGLCFTLGTERKNLFISTNGMAVTETGISVLINGRLTTNNFDTAESIPSGIWEYTKETGFYHKYSPSYTAINSSTVTDYGQKSINFEVGALADAKTTHQGGADPKASLVCGMRYYKDGTNSNYGIFVDNHQNTLQKYGYIILPQILSGSFTETWQSVVPRFRKLLASTDSIVVKHRIDRTPPVQISLTWVNTSSFTTTTDVSGMVGYEVEILNGTGGGKCAHILSVTGSGTYTVTLDDTFTGVTTGTAVAHVTQWYKDGVYTSQNENYNEFSVSEKSTVVTVKICFQITGDWELYDIMILNQTDKQAK
jgi:hypothetical protein